MAKLPFVFALFAMLPLVFAEINIKKIKDDTPVYYALVTGFLPFLNYSENPSQYVAEMLNGKCTTGNVTGFPLFTICWEAWILPVNETGSTRVQDYLLQNEDNIIWDAIIHLGLEDSAHGIKIETILADNNTLPIINDGPDVLPVSVDLSYFNIRTILNGLHNTTDAWSRDAGTYYCNETLYRTLYTIRGERILGKNRKRGLLPAVFVHLPEADDTTLAQDAVLVSRVGAEMIAPIMLDV